jgi:hypothetical protein
MNNVSATNPLNAHYFVPSTTAGSTSADTPVADAGSVGSVDDFAAGLSPDALMAYCQSRLDSIDGQMGDLMTSQNQNAGEVKLINDINSTLQTYDAGLNDKSQCADLETKLQGQVQSLMDEYPSCPSLDNIVKAYNTVVYSGDGGAAYQGNSTGPSMISLNGEPFQYDKPGPQGDGQLTATEMQGYMQTMSDAASQLNSQSELAMVNLQSLMSQRQTAISLTTNLVQSLGDQASKIADNIGH